jgi:hypothetical protein
MHDIFSRYFGDPFGAYVKASLRRDHDAREIYLFLEERLRRDRRLLRRRIARLEQEQAEFHQTIEDLVEDVERLNADLTSCNRMLRTSPVSPECVCEPTAQPTIGEEVQPAAGDDWTQV